MLRQSAHEGGKVVSPTHRPPLAPGNIPGTHFWYRLSRPQIQSAAGRIMSMKDSNDTIENRFRNLTVCSAVPQPNAPPRATVYRLYEVNIKKGLLFLVSRFSRKGSNVGNGPSIGQRLTDQLHMTSDYISKQLKPLNTESVIITTNSFHLT
jgi:hypothetical protein